MTSPRPRASDEPADTFFVGSAPDAEPVPLDARRTFWSKGEVFEMRLPSRGFYYELDPPVPVDVLEGRVRGTRQTPITGYVHKPGVKYASTKPPPSAPSGPESRAGGGEGP